MATLHKEYISFNSEIKLNEPRKIKLKASRKEIRKKIRKWFSENKPDELQPKFYGQGSFEMNTIINPIPTEDENGNKCLKYDLDYGIYFIVDGVDNIRKAIETYHDWVYKSVENHTNQPPKRKNTCVRVVFADGHHIDLPIYYKENEIPELAHKGKGWIESDPKEFFEWFNNKAKNNQQLRRIVRYLKAWKDYRETSNTNLKLPSGFILTILAVNNYVDDDSDDQAFLETLQSIKADLDNNFECYRPTTPKDEDLFSEYLETRKTDFLTNLANLIQACEKANDEENFKSASEHLRKQFGDRFPHGKDESTIEKSKRLGAALASSPVTPKPFGGYGT
jgi:hypothetical protein